MNPKRVEFLGDAQLVHHRKVDAFALTAIAQGRIVDFDFGFHNTPAKADRNIYAKAARMQSPNQGGKQEGSPRARNTVVSSR
jgi:hypothetical protein